MSENLDLKPSILKLISALDKLKLDYAVIGGLAVILRGYNRATSDIDAVVLDLDDRLLEALDVLKAVGFELRQGVDEAFIRRHRVIPLVTRGASVDLSMGVLPLEYELVANATWESIDAITQLKVATVEDLILLKVTASRERDIDDVKRLLELYPHTNRHRILAKFEEIEEFLEEPAIGEIARRVLGL